MNKIKTPQKWASDKECEEHCKKYTCNECPIAIQCKLFHRMFSSLTPFEEEIEEYIEDHNDRTTKEKQ